MKKMLESLAKKGKVLVAAGAAALMVGCASMSSYFSPRMGMIAPLKSKEQPYNASFSVGAAYGFGSSKSGLGLEAGVNYTHSSAPYVETDNFLSDWTVNFSPVDLFAPDASIKPYLSTGVAMLNEFSTINVPNLLHKNVSDSLFGLEAGGGVLLGNTVEIGGKYLYFPWSQNVQSAVEGLVGFHFELGK